MACDYRLKLAVHAADGPDGNALQVLDGLSAEMRAFVDRLIAVERQAEAVAQYG
ncbi:hypothetical protein [Kitasatospora sp. LaBMicrA B282]|uniref:hypothetical protein n=1 Tax=Kitasatospora sp. LaBMicrA B282 TaxID=3420949 RepID=UPI003D122EDF